MAENASNKPTENQLKGGKGKIHLHPNHNTNGFAKNKGAINSTGLNRKLVGTVNHDLEKNGIKEDKKH
jgi:hypothetical protein